MNRRALIAAVPLFAVAACSAPATPPPPQDTTSGSSAPSSPASSEPSAPASSPSDLRTQPLPLDGVYHSETGVDVQFVDWEVGKLDATYTEDQKEGDPLVFFTLKLTNTGGETLDIGGSAGLYAINGANSDEVTLTGAADWKPRFPPKLLPGKSASQRFGWLGKVSEMTDMTVMQTWSELGIDALWTGDVSKLV